MQPTLTDPALDYLLQCADLTLTEAEKADLIPINISQPETGVWLIQPQQELPAGEYALMLGTQNINIFPFSVAAPSPPSVTPGKH